MLMLAVRSKPSFFADASLPQTELSSGGAAVFAVDALFEMAVKAVKVFRAIAPTAF